MDDKYIGKIINGHEVLKKAGKLKDGHQLYEVKCLKCGKIRILRISALKRLSANKCIHPVNVIRNGRLCSIFRSMVYRCYNSGDKSYKFYGAKGITICE